VRKERCRSAFTHTREEARWFKFDKLVVARFDAEHASSDGGAVLLKALDGQLGVTEAVASCLRDRRQRGKVQHELVDLYAGASSGCSAAIRMATTPPG
jgi:Transposase DDE domain group 1